MLGASSAQADIYRYRDANGMAHYTDNQLFIAKRLPTSGQEYELNRDGVLTRVIEKEDGHYLLMLNRLDKAVNLSLQFYDTRNVVIPPELQKTLLLPAKTETVIGKVTANGSGDWRYQYKFSYQYGASKGQLAKKNVSKLKTGAHKQRDYFPASRTPSLQNSTSSLVYRGKASHLNYQGGAHDLGSPVIGRYRISQGFNGAYSHNKLDNRYALDIALPVGTPLYASRAGVVVAAVDTHVGGGLAPQYRGKANHLRVRHSDGSMTLYAHLQTGSLRVAKGDKVRLGQPIAASGNTGYTSGPHLHMALQIDNGGQRESIPFTLQGNQPLAGKWLSGTAWGDE
ncbi:M23 family metallopeptidase [Oceanisphaera sp. IT1-181]|uniref:M23 family metallopeptidase n=1 Tax=Oceanisphaera sp. IT1-181 TaxID=3081199 RepID=UPI0029C9C027|nr:M23 family metallopeptidase [Oceanisphaera sp. IT1-181]